MKLLRAFDTYLLEHHPILWHSKVTYLLLTGIVFWLAFFGAGYLLMDIELLKNTGISRYYENSYAMLVHVLLVIIAFSLWALFFFKKNAVRHYYPLSRWYFTRLFVCMAIGFLAIVTANIPFDYGVRLKTRSLLDLGEMQQDAQAANLAMPFLPSGDVYYLSKRTFPEPFPLREIILDENDSTWNDGDLHYEDSAGNILQYRAIDHPENTVRIDDRNYQLLKVKHISDETPCYNTTYDLITDYWVPDSSFALHRTSILNYSGVSFPGAFKKGPYTPLTAGYGNYPGKEYAEHYAPTVHRWVHADQKDSIVYAIGQLEKVLQRYSIGYAWDKQRIAAYLSECRYTDFNTDFIDDNPYNKELKWYERRLPGVNLRDLSNEGMYTMGYNKEDLETLYENAEVAYYHEFDEETAWSLVVLATVLALLFLLFDFAHLIHFLIAIPVSGALMILTAMGAVTITYLTRSHHHEEFYGMIFCFLFGTLIFALCIAATLSRFFGKRLAGILLIIGYGIAPLYLCFFVVFMDECTKYYAPHACGGFYYEHTFWHDLGNTPWVMFSLALIGAISYFALIKRWYAKEE
jgi:hypothetical protein